ncbi:MAG: type II toxin-antitoxin system Phd/YefM family antitoxin [Acidobacteriales bacterium]|nr:type II toxin-antitoxin system Phd/YefM family antitoxin [Terriglobales bacterium]
MKQMAISEFKAKCLAVVDEVQKTKRGIVITRFGKPVAEVVPHSEQRPQHWMGSMKDRIQILGDILSPATNPSDWEVLRD